ncbi:MAG: hypothetical protein AABZ65_00210 [Candidatus Omnitrophota bacterium]
MRKQIVQKLSRYFNSLKAREIRDLSLALNQEIRRLNIHYLNDSGSKRDIKLVLRPWFIKPKELAFFHRLIYAFKAANHKLFALYLADARIREIMPLRRQEWKWFQLINKRRLQRHQVVFGRWDTNVSFDERENITDIKFLETNTVGIGGIHYIPVVSEAIKKLLKTGFEKTIHPYSLRFQADPRQLLAEEIKLHARRIGRKGLNVAFLENRDYAGGTVEIPELSKYFLKLGINALAADPRQLHLKGKEIYCRDTRIDIMYRDSELQELIDIERKGHNMEVLKQAFINNQVISSIEGELDHKSGFEIFSSPEFSRLFTAQERALFKKYIPWTRLLKDRKTTDTQSRIVDLVPYVIKHKDALTIKPNRAYGGKGVVIGHTVSKNKWQEYIVKALSARDEYVAQSFVNIREETFPWFTPDGRVAFDKFYSVSGFVVNHHSTAVLGRFSKEMVVNVARKGGIIPTLVLEA